MPEPTSAELAREAEQEAAVFAQAVNVEKLLNMLRALDPAKDNLADNEEIQVGTSRYLLFACSVHWCLTMPFTRNCIDRAWRSDPRS
jgi:hypothetical protein